MTLSSVSKQKVYKEDCCCSSVEMRDPESYDNTKSKLGWYIGRGFKYAGRKTCDFADFAAKQFNDYFPYELMNKIIDFVCTCFRNFINHPLTKKAGNLAVDYVFQPCYDFLAKLIKYIWNTYISPRLSQHTKKANEQPKEHVPSEFRKKMYNWTVSFINNVLEPIRKKIVEFVKFIFTNEISKRIFKAIDETFDGIYDGIFAKEEPKEPEEKKEEELEVINKLERSQSLVNIHNVIEELPKLKRSQSMNDITKLDIKKINFNLS